MNLEISNSNYVHAVLSDGRGIGCIETTLFLEIVRMAQSNDSLERTMIADIVRQLLTTQSPANYCVVSRRDQCSSPSGKTMVCQPYW